MNLIPDKNLFLVTSAIKPLDSVFFTDEQRMHQTIDTLISIRKKMPESIIILAEASFNPLSDGEKTTLQQFCNGYIDLSTQTDVRGFSGVKLKSQAETALLFHSLMILKQQPFICGVKRIFKFSGRTILDDSFNLSEYEGLFGKYVFKKRIPTWMPRVVYDASDLLITRMYSFCPSLIDNYLEVLGKNLDLLNHMDTEHAHFVNIPKKYLVEFDTIHCTGWLSGNGQIEKY
jgi:hypothetical protein